MKRLFAYTFFLLTLYFCEEPVQTVLIDNPSDEILKFEFVDIIEYHIAPKETREIKIRFGKRKIRINNGDQTEIYLDKDLEYLINPLKETYYIEHLLYFKSNSAKENYYRFNKQPASKIEGINVNGIFTKIDSNLLIPKTWAYGIGENESIRAKFKQRTKKGYYTVRKLHRKNDIMNKILDDVSSTLENYKIETEK